MVSIFDHFDATDNAPKEQPVEQTQDSANGNLGGLSSVASAPDENDIMSLSSMDAGVSSTSGARTNLPQGIFPPPPAIDATPEEVTRHCLDKCIICLDHMQYGRDTLAETWQHIANHPEHKDLLQPQDMAAIHQILLRIAGNKFAEVKEKTTARAVKAEEKAKKIEAFDNDFGSLGSL